MDKKFSRRTILKRGLQIPLGGSVLFGLAACGSCEMFDGKAVNPSGHCDSWNVNA